MTVTVSASVSLQHTINTTITDTPIEGANRQLTFTDGNWSETRKSDSDVPVTKRYVNTHTGTVNFDLTSLTDPDVGSVDMSGLKVQNLYVFNRSTTDALTISDGAANAYQLNGGNDLVVPAGGRVALDFNEKLADVGAADKAFDVTPAAGEKFDIVILAG